jgi:uncharacterized protein YjiS (DUF1127 family)
MACSRHYHFDHVASFQSASVHRFGLLNLVGIVTRVVEGWRARTEHRRQLDMLLRNDRLRADVGVSRVDVQQEYARLFWRVYPRSRPPADQQTCHGQGDGTE